jgi:uncharacterized DUF497 family protein
VRFIWYENKRRENLAKHGIDFADAGEMFDGPLLEFLDSREDYGEDRFIGLGFIQGRATVIVYSEPEEDTLRVISLRKATNHEREKFEKELAHRLGQS